MSGIGDEDDDSFEIQKTRDIPLKKEKKVTKTKEIEKNKKENKDHIEKHHDKPHDKPHENLNDGDIGKCISHTIQISEIIPLVNKKPNEKLESVFQYENIDVLKLTNNRFPLKDCHIKNMKITARSKGSNTPIALTMLLKKSNNYAFIKDNFMNVKSINNDNKTYDDDDETIDGKKYSRIGNLFEKNAGRSVFVIKGDDIHEGKKEIYYDVDMSLSDKNKVLSYLTMVPSSGSDNLNWNKKFVEESHDSNEIFVYFNTIIHDMLCFVFEEYIPISDSRKLSGRIGLHVSIEHYNITVCKFKEFLPSCEIHDLDSFKLGILPFFGKTKKHDDDAYIYVEFEIQYDHYSKK